MSQVQIDQFRDYLLDLQDRLCAKAESFEETARFRKDHLQGERQGFARPRVLERGGVFERAAVNFSLSGGAELSPAATLRRPQLAGKAFQAVSLSMIFHPRNPYVPTSHMNLRLFVAGAGAEAVWWFGGGFDLTPYYGFDQDAIDWHCAARDALEPHGNDLYPQMKADCDAYFFLKHRKECRGIGGVFYDDMNSGGYARCEAISRAVGEAFLSTYFALVERRRHHVFGDRERRFQQVRRGRYVEFNLLQDRGTLYGLQAGARVESVLASMPPSVQWQYDREEEPGSHEARLCERYLVPQDWVSLSPKS